jgi:anaerobic ribonucleoside-triphosphate reductase
MDITSIFNEDASTGRTIRNIKKSLEYSLKEKYGIEDQEIINSMMNVHGLSKDKFDIVSNVEKIIASHINDSSIDANSNKNTKTVESTFQETFLPFKKAIGYDYLYRIMKEMYGKKEAKRLAGEMYDMSLVIADSTSLLRPYCYAMNAQFINVEGRKWGTLFSKPAKRLSSYISALCETVHEMSNEMAGACLHKSQELIYKKNNKIYSTKIEDIIKEYTLNNKYSNYQGEWEYSNVENLDVLENEGNFVKVNKIMRRKYNDDIYEIKTKSGKSVRVSKDHIFKVLFKGREIEVKAKDLQLYDTVFNTQIYGLPINKESQDYKDGQFYGILAGDGEITPKYCNRVAINYKQKFIADFLDDYLVDSNKTLLDGNGCFSYNIYGKDICNKIKETFNGSYCYDKELKNIEEKSLDFLVGFLDGILVTDGAYNNSINIGLVNKKLIDNIKTILKKINIQYSERTIGENKEKNKKEMYFLNIPYKATQFLSLTNCKINKTKNDKSFGFDIPYYGNQAFSHSSSLWTSNKCKTYGERDIINHSPITDVIIEINMFSNDSEYVYEIETESHWYSVGGLLTHNCAISTFFFDSFHVLQLKENISLNEIRENKTIRKYIENEFQQFVHSVNHLSRNASESPFTNLSIFDSVKLRYMIEEMKWYFGEFDTDYVIDYVMELQKIFIEFFDKGDPEANGRPYRFPVITICFSKKVNGTDKIEDKKFLDYVSKKDVYRYNIFVSEGTKIASCCRLISDTEMMDMASSVNSFGGSGISMGSHRVVTIDFTRIALESKTIEDYYNLIKERTESTTKILKAHKHLIETLAERGLQKFITNGIISMKRMFSTYGIIGLVEAEEILKKKFGDDDTISNSLILLNDLAKEFSKKYEVIINIEQIPAETVAQRSLVSDRIIFSNSEYLKDYHLFSNQFVPLWKEATIYERLEADGKYNRLITGGGIVHAQIGEKVTPTQAKEIINYAVECGCEHFALNSVYSQCKNNHNHFGKLKICPTCNEEIVEYFTRVVGFFVPVSSWIKERREWEFDERKFI